MTTPHDKALEAAERVKQALAAGFWTASVSDCQPPRSKRDNPLKHSRIIRLHGRFATEELALKAAQDAIAVGRPSISTFIHQESAKPIASFYLDSNAVSIIGRDVPHLLHAPIEADGGAGWLPIDRADKSIDRIIEAAGLRIGNSEEYWVRDADGRAYQAVWSDDGRRAYWFDLDGESPVDPVEFMPHPLDRRFSSIPSHEGREKA